MIAEAAHHHQMTNTHLLFQEFTYLEPASLSEATSILKQYGERAGVLAGGTYLLVQMKMERQAPELILNIKRIHGLAGVSGSDDGVHIGPCSTMYAIRNLPEIQRDYAALAEACAAFGSTQIQKMGTIGGNLCNGSPASDTVPALMAFDAQLVLNSATDERQLAVETFLLGPGETALREGELLASIHLPRPRRGTGSAFIKISRVAADLAKVSAAAVLVQKEGRIVRCRLAFGSVASSVMRAKKAEQLLTGQPFSRSLALEAGKIASEEVSPIDDVRSTAWYRRQVVKAVTHDVLCQAWERARQDETSSKDRSAAHGGKNASVVQHATPNNTPRAIRNAVRVGPGEKHPISLMVNGERQPLWVTPNELLLNVLRERLGLTGTKYGCGIGECGACTVHLDGEPALACLTLAIAVDGSEVRTVEGLQHADGKLDPLQDAFIQQQAFQCGYCTPGMLMMTKSMLNEMPAPTEDHVREYLRGNRCRCTGFASIVRAVLSQANSAENQTEEA